MAANKKDDDVTSPSPPAVSPGLQPPPPSLPTYPTCGFIEERFNVLRNGLTATSTNITNVKTTFEETLGKVKEDLLSVANGTDGKVEAVLNKVEADGNLTRSNLTGAVQDLQKDVRDRKEQILEGQLSIKNHIEDDIRSALGMETARERVPLWDKVQAAETKVDTVTATINRSETAINGVAVGVGEAKGMVSAMNGTLNAFGGTLATIASDVGNVKTDAAAAARDASTIKTIITDATCGLSALTNTISGVATTVGLQGSRLDILATHIATLSASVTTLTSVVSGLLAAIGADASDKSTEFGNRDEKESGSEA